MVFSILIFLIFLITLSTFIFFSSIIFILNDKFLNIVKYLSKALMGNPHFSISLVRLVNFNGTTSLIFLASSSIKI